MSPQSTPSPERPIAYFCAEFGLSQQLPIYSGGLGVLAGDMVKQANDQNLPLVAIGIFYQQGYFVQKINQGGQQVPSYQNIDPSQAGLELVKTASGETLAIIIPHASGPIRAQVWKHQIGNIPLYLLDSAIDQNDEHASITRHLYDPDPETRIKQEMLLGIGGAKLLRSLGISPSIYHLNEGHSAFATYELAAEIMHERGYRYSQAQSAAANNVVFTNHTVVAAGNDRFGNHQVRFHLRAYAEAEGLPIADMVAAGADPHDENDFSMTNLALNHSAKANTVSKLHHQIARTVWPDYHFHSITNGIHLPTWTAKNIQDNTPSLNLIGLNQLEDRQLWQLHQQNKQELIRYINQKDHKHFDPNILTIVWARRFAGYKRANLVLQDTKQLKRLVGQNQIQLVFAGKAHPNDEIGQGIIDSINRQIRLVGLEDSVVFLPNYNIDMAATLVAGADIWLNTPRRGQEASGTSGMKSGANGVLQLSISDGWMDEVNWDTAGWMLPEEQTDEAIYTYINQQILPMFHNRNQQGVPEEWVKRMHQTMQIIWSRYSAARMVKEYQEVLYS